MYLKKKCNIIYLTNYVFIKKRQFYVLKTWNLPINRTRNSNNSKTNYKRFSDFSRFSILYNFFYILVTLVVLKIVTFF